MKIMIASVAANVVLLASFKYFFDDMPVGMSFFTFTVLSYLFDVYGERTEAQRNPVNFILYVSFFPKLLSGPIVQYADMESQLTGRKADADKLMDGGVLFLSVWERRYCSQTHSERASPCLARLRIRSSAHGS